MKIKVLSSGSKGNCTYIECGNTRFLIDMGITLSKLKGELQEISISIDDIDFIILTHTHSDHIKGLKALLSKSNIKLYTTSLIYEKLIEKMNIDTFHMINEEFDYNNINIKLLPLSHDVICYGFVVSYEKNKLVYITDTGYLNRRYFDEINNCDIYIIESNHDEKMLMGGNYPHVLKQRIIGDYGHLSNAMSASILRRIIGPRTKYIILAHLSEENNLKELAEEEMKKNLKDFDFRNLIIADQYLSTETVEIV